MIDIHCHLEYMPDIIDEAKKKMNAVISSVADLKDKDKAMKLREENPDFVYVSLGLHPHHAVEYSDEEIDNYIEFIRQNKEKIVAIGECGLDYKQVKEEDRERSKEVFIRFIELAVQLKKPLVIHSRGEPGSNAVFDEIFGILEKYELTVVLHCFSGNETQLKEALDRGYYISYATIICKSDKHKRLAKQTPLSNMLLETDSPWLHPTSNELINRPWLIEESAKVIAEIKQLTPEEIIQQADENSKKIFGIK